MLRRAAAVSWVPAAPVTRPGSGYYPSRTASAGPCRRWIQAAKNPVKCPLARGRVSSPDHDWCRPAPPARRPGAGPGAGARARPARASLRDPARPAGLRPRPAAAVPPRNRGLNAVSMLDS